MRVDPLVVQYPIRVRMMTFLVLITISAAFYVFPRAMGEAASTRKMNVIDWEPPILPPNTDYELPPEQAPPRATVPVASDDPEIPDDITMGDEFFEAGYTPFDMGALPPMRDPTAGIIFREWTQKPEIIDQLQVDYPEMAQMAGIEGTVVVEFVISADGKVSDPVIIKSIMGLDEAAIAAIMHSRWRPAMQRDRKVAVYMQQKIVFRLDD